MPKFLDPNTGELLGCILICGIVSGYASYLWQDKTPVQLDPSQTQSSDWQKYVVISVVAAATVPLFLQTISSQLIIPEANGYAKPTNYFVFSGLCLLAGFSAPQYLKRLTSKIFEDIDNANSKANQAVKQANIAVTQSEQAINVAESLIPDDKVEPDAPPIHNDVEEEQE